jgi:hypothetical protein
VLFPTRVERRSDQRKANENNELDDLACPFPNGIDAESYIIESDLEPGKPKDGEESDVRHQGVCVNDRVSACKCGQIRDEEEIEAKLKRA